MHITQTNKTGCCYCYFFFCCCCCFVYLNIYCAAQWQIHKYTQTLENIFLPALLLLIHTWFLLFESEYSTPEHIIRPTFYWSWYLSTMYSCVCSRCYSRVSPLFVALRVVMQRPWIRSYLSRLFANAQHHNENIRTKFACCLSTSLILIRFVSK